mgnify:FL=1
MGKVPLIPESFLAKINFNGPIWHQSPCWLWTGEKNGGGYGYFYVSILPRRKTGAHRYLYGVLRGPFPSGMQSDHLCRNHSCVNPEHIEPVSRRTNILRGVGPTALHARQTHCIYSHPLDEANTYITPQGVRQCRACNRRRNREYEARRKAKK